MEINPNASVPPLSQGLVNKPPSRPRPAADNTRFDAAERLDEALRAEPEARPGEVQRAERLIGEVTYPPQATIRSLAVLLAMHLDNPPE
jgi:hypothetical protein